MEITSIVSFLILLSSAWNFIYVAGLTASKLVDMPGGLAALPLGVAQLGRAPALGAGGRWFESSHPDHLQQFRRGNVCNRDFAPQSYRL